MTEDQAIGRGEILALTTEIVSAHVANNAVVQGEVPELIQSVFNKLNELATGEEPASVELTPAVPIKKSVTDDYIICLEDGKKLKMLKRHLMTAYNMTPEEYRAQVGAEARLSDGRAELCRQAAGARQEDRSRAQAPRGALTSARGPSALDARPGGG